MAELSLLNDTALIMDIALIIIVATLMAVITSKLKQPLILGYVAAGVIIGPILNVVSNAEPIKILSELGISFLLFIIGR